MSRPTIRRPLIGALAAAALAATTLGTVTTAQANHRDATMDLPRKTSKYSGVGPHRPYVQEINMGGVVPLKNQAIINKTAHGYLFRAGQQHTRLTMTQTNGRLRFVDTGTQSWKWLPPSCTKLRVPKGVGASCGIEGKFTDAAPMLVEVWPRLGNDVVDSTALPRRFDVAFLGDKGNDVARFGAGNDFFNGAQDHDRGYGGGGHDWMRGNKGDDVIDGEEGNDYLVGVQGHDTVHGGPGNDRIFGLAGNDKLVAGHGSDHVSCGIGRDRASVTSGDKTISCEALSRYGG